MALETTPFMVGGGAEHSAGIARSIAYAATGGKEGIGAPGDLKVAAQSVPNGTVRVYPGVATILNSYAGGTGQSYVAKNLTQTTVTIQPTTSSGSRSDLIVLSITDPEFEGAAPSDPNNFNYTRLEVISGVPSSTQNLDEIEYPRPAIPLARIDIPKSTGTITSGMIKNLRFLANPRSERQLFTYNLTGDEWDQLNWTVAQEPDGEQFPNKVFVTPIPEWAQRVRVVATWAQLRIPGGGGNQHGNLWVRWGTMANGFNSQSVKYDLNSTVTGVLRETYVCANDRSIPKEYRGRDMSLSLRGSVFNNATNTPQVDNASAISIDVEYYETAI